MTIVSPWCVAACAAALHAGALAADAPVPGTECVPDVRVSEAYAKAGLRAGAMYRNLRQITDRLQRESGLRARIVNRPVDPNDDGRLLAMNPHDRSGAFVCRNHQVELYVGRAPFWSMPAVAVTGKTAADARQALFGLPDPQVEWSGDKGDEARAMVVAQWPAASAAAGKGDGQLSRFHMPNQAPILFVRSEPPAPPKPPVPECPEVVKKADPEPEPSTGSGTALAGGAAGLGLGALLARFAQGGGGGPGTPIPPQRGTAAQLPATRIRPDLDSAETVAETGRG